MCPFLVSCAKGGESLGAGFAFIIELCFAFLSFVVCFELGLLLVCYRLWDMSLCEIYLHHLLWVICPVLSYISIFLFLYYSLCKSGIVINPPKRGRLLGHSLCLSNFGDWWQYRKGLTVCVKISDNTRQRHKTTRLLSSGTEARRSLRFSLFES